MPRSPYYGCQIVSKTLVLRQRLTPARALYLHITHLRLCSPSSMDRASQATRKHLGVSSVVSFGITSFSLLSCIVSFPLPHHVAKTLRTTGCGVRRARLEHHALSHQRQILRPRPGREAINAGSRHPKKRTLPAHRHGSMPAVDHGQAVRPAHLPDLLDKKSRSTVSWPIFAYSSAISRSRPSSRPGDVPKTAAAWSSSCFFQP